MYWWIYRGRWKSGLLGGLSEKSHWQDRGWQGSKKEGRGGRERAARGGTFETRCSSSSSQWRRGMVTNLRWLKDSMSQSLSKMWFLWSVKENYIPNIKRPWDIYSVDDLMNLTYLVHVTINNMWFGQHFV